MEVVELRGEDEKRSEAPAVVGRLAGALQLLPPPLPLPPLGRRGKRVAAVVVESLLSALLLLERTAFRDKEEEWWRRSVGDADESYPLVLSATRGFPRRADTGTVGEEAVA